AFIVLCAFTHFMDIVTVWHGVYWLDGAVRALTAVASAATAVWLFPLFPQVVAFRHLLVAERELSRTKIMESERHFRELVDNLPDLAWTARPDGHIDFYNRRWYDYTGTTPADMEGWGWRSVHEPTMLGWVEELWGKSLQTGAPFEMEFPLRAKTGAYRWFLTRVQPLRDADGTITRWVGTNTDIDERRRHQDELVQSVQRRDEFLSIASHELRTPLQALVLHLDTTALAITRGDSRDALATRVAVATKHIDRLTSLIDSMLDVSKVALERLELVREDVDLVAVVRDVVERQQGRAHQVGSTVSVRAPASLVGAWDRSRLDQVVTNVLANAIKYGQGRPIAITIEQTGMTTQLAIEDQGIGIDPADHERIFTRFERAASHNYGGLGLGLFIAREIVRAHGGEIHVESRLGHGARFVVSLPIQPPPESSS
ncbi:MAG TPA: PAS domain-containing sensor histidine kinase, partial [Kofleriaceae bacterium]|nr:PAS domain-containing sensor histidine kinase [Kofleriaceae bacterium]